MPEVNIKLDKVLADPLFRKALHIIGTVIFGYILLRLILFIFDTTHLGTAWLETNQDTGFFIIILILVSLLLLTDHAISYARRNYGEEKHSIIDVGLTVARSNIKKYESKSPETIKPLIQKILALSNTKEKKPPEIVEPRSRVSNIIASELSGLSQKYQKEEPASPEVAVEPVKQKPIETSTPIKVLASTKAPTPEIEKPRSRVSDIIASELSGLSQKYQKEEPASPEVAVEPVKQKPIETSTPTKAPDIN